MSMSLVNRSDSPGFGRVFGSQDGVRTESTRRAERVHGDDDAGRHCAETDGPGRRNPLVGALMQALKGLMAESAAPPAAASDQASTGSGNAGAASAVAGGSGTDAAAASAATTDGSSDVLSPSTAATSGGTSLSGDLKDAAYAFAKELFLALRSEGPRGDGHHREDHDHGHHHGHGRGGHGGHGDYGSFGGLVHRLQSLAIAYGGTGETPGTATPATATGPSTLAAGTATATDAAPAEASTDPATGTVDAVPANATSSFSKPGLSINIQVSLTVNVGAAATPPATSSATPPAAESPLLSAFRNLMSKLQSPGGGAAASSPDAGNATDAPAATAADKLKGFLLNLASALQAGRSEDASARPGVGSLVDLQA